MRLANELTMGSHNTLKQFGSWGINWLEGMDLGWDFCRGINYYGSSMPTDTRNSTVYAPNAAGVYTPYAANVLTRTDLGSQTVPTRVELVAAPITFGEGSWSRTGINTVTADQAVAPDGTQTADQVIENNLNSAHQVAASITFTAATYTASVFAKPAGRNWVRIAVIDSGGTTRNAYFNVATGTVGTVGGALTASIVPSAYGFYRCVVTWASNAATNNFIVAPASADAASSYQGDNVSGIYPWGANVQLGAFAVPPITIGSATVAGNQQVISLPTQLAVGVAGVVQWNPLAVADGVTIVEFNDATSSNRVVVKQSSGNIAVEMISGGASQGTVSSGALTAGTIATAAFAFSGNFFTVRLVGSANPTPDTSGTYASFSQATIGSRGTVGATSAYQYTRKLALKFGPQDAGTFAQMYARAVLAHAAG